ncbi:MAG: hypothetical protein KAW93_05375 [Methanogenium sp.]|nr:hypothetical protein [Methanogenium sp.]
MKQLPVKVDYEDKWISLKIGLADDRLILPDPIDREIPFKSINDVIESKNALTINLSGTTPEKHKIASIPKVLNIIRRKILMGCSAYRLMAYFMSPAIKGGVMVSDSKWEKGAVAILNTGIWFVGQNQQVCIPIAEVSGIEQTERDVQGKNTEVVKIDHVELGEVVTSFVLCPPTTLQVLFNYLKDATKSQEIDTGAIDPVSAQVAMLVYSGMDSHAIENMVSLSHEELESLYDKLIEMNIAEVAMTRREVKLTTKGVRFVSNATRI